MQKKQLILYGAAGILGVAVGVSAVFFLSEEGQRASLKFDSSTPHTEPFQPLREPWKTLPWTTLQLFSSEASSPIPSDFRHLPSSERLAAALVRSLDKRPDGTMPFSHLLPPHFMNIASYTRLLCPADALLEQLLNKPVELNLEQQLMVQRSLLYQPAALRYAAEYHVDPALVLAIMQVESRFRTQDVSHRHAVGLMQIVPGTAGREIWRWLKKEGRPSVQELMEPEQNIRYGTMYLHLLLDRHFGGVLHPLSREYCVIASYNGGSGVVLRLFGETPKEAFHAINRLSPEDLYDFLLARLPSGETRAFLQQVLEARRVYRAELKKNS